MYRAQGSREIPYIHCSYNHRKQTFQYTNCVDTYFFFFGFNNRTNTIKTGGKLAPFAFTEDPTILSTPHRNIKSGINTVLVVVGLETVLFHNMTRYTRLKATTTIRVDFKDVLGNVIDYLERNHFVLWRYSHIGIAIIIIIQACAQGFNIFKGRLN